MYYNCILANQLNFLPRNYIILAFSEYSQKTASSENHKRNNFSAFGINYDIINKVCGTALILVGAAMATGTLGRLLNILS